MKMFVVDMAEGKFRVKKGLGITYGTSGKKRGFKNFWMGCIEGVRFDDGIFLSKDIQATLPEIPEDFIDRKEVMRKTRIMDDLGLIEHPTIPDRWMAVHNDVNKAIVFFSKDDFNIVFPITKSIELVEKDCPHNHRLTDIYSGGNECRICGAKGIIRSSDDKIFFALAEKYGIEIGNGQRKIENFLHVNDGKVKVFTTGCHSGYELSQTAETKYCYYPSFELALGKKILVGATVGKDLFIVSISFDGSEIKLNLEKKIEGVVFDFLYELEVGLAKGTLDRLISSRQASKPVIESTQEVDVEDSPFAILKNMKFDN